MTESRNTEQFGDILNQYFSLCSRQITLMENMSTRMSNVIDTYCDNVHTFTMSNTSTSNSINDTHRRRQSRDTYRPMSSIFGTTPLRQNPFGRPPHQRNYTTTPFPRRTPRVRVNTRPSPNLSTSSQTLFGSRNNNLSEVINNTLNTATWSHSIPSIQYISASTVSARWPQFIGEPSITNYRPPVNNSCPIRQRPFEEDDEVIMISHCRHCFVRESLIQWFGLDSRCPVCRWDIYGCAQSNDISNNIWRPSLSWGGTQVGWLGGPNPFQRPLPPPRPTVPPPPPPPPISSPPAHPFTEDLLQEEERQAAIRNQTQTSTNLPTIPGIDTNTHNFLTSVTNTIESGLSNVLHTRGIDLSTNIIEASYTFSLPTPPERGNLFNEETFHIRQRISPIPPNINDVSNNIISDEETIREGFPPNRV